MRKQHRDAQIFHHGGAYQIYQILCWHYPKINNKVVTVNLSSFLCHCTTEKRWRKMKGADVVTSLRSEISLLIRYCCVSVFHCGTHALGHNLSFMSLHYQILFSALGPSMNWSLLGGDLLRHQGVYTVSGVQTLFFLASVLRHLREITRCVEPTGFWTGGSCDCVYKGGYHSLNSEWMKSLRILKWSMNDLSQDKLEILTYLLWFLIKLLHVLLSGYCCLSKSSSSHLCCFQAWNLTLSPRHRTWSLSLEQVTSFLCTLDQWLAERT